MKVLFYWKVKIKREILTSSAAQMRLTVSRRWNLHGCQILRAQLLAANSNKQRTAKSLSVSRRRAGVCLGRFWRSRRPEQNWGLDSSIDT